MNKQEYKAAERAYRQQCPSRGLVTPPPAVEGRVETHFRALWNDRFIAGTRFDEAYQPVSTEYALYQVYGRGVVASVLRGEF
jgi:hypothetical protein